MTLWEITVKGGVVMIPILLCGALTVAIIIERIISLRRAATDVEAFLPKIEETLRRRKIREALELCDRNLQPIPALIKAGILKSDRSPQEIREAIDDAARHQIPVLERYLGILATIATVAPLLGLLGTVTGLINCFMVIQAKGGLVNPGDLAGGIWQALITTVAGLVVAIPAYLAYNYFVSRVNMLVLEMEKTAARLLDVFFLLKAEEA